MIKIIPVVVICLFLAFFSDVFSTKNSLKSNYEYKEKFIWIFIAVAMAIFAGLRIKYNDTTTYLREYERLFNPPFDFTDFDWSFGSNPGFKVVGLLLKFFGFSNNGYLIFYSLITYIIYIWFIHKYSSDFLMSIFLFICLVFTFPLAAIKQCVAVAFCLIAVDKAINKKWFWFVFFVFIAETFHAYSFMYLIVPFMFFTPWKSKKTYIWIVLFFLAGIMLKLLLGTVLSITESLGDNYTLEDFSGEGVNPLRLAVCLVPLVLSFILRKHISNTNIEMSRADNLCLNLSFLNGEIMFVALFGTANYFARLANYFYIFPVITLPRLFNMFSPKWRVPIKLAVIICYFLFFYYSLCLAHAPFDDEYASIPISEFRFFQA